MREAAEAQTVAYQTGQVPITTVLDARRMELMKQDDYLMTPGGSADGSGRN